MNIFPKIEGIEIKGTYKVGYESVLTAEAQQFLKGLHLKFNERRKEFEKEIGR